MVFCNQRSNNDKKNKNTSYHDVSIFQSHFVIRLFGAMLIAKHNFSPIFHRNKRCNSNKFNNASMINTIQMLKYNEIISVLLMFNSAT
jgi:hypothetical protein